MIPSLSNTYNGTRLQPSNKILKTPYDSVKGYIVEVNIQFPLRLHDTFKELPRCAEYQTLKIDQRVPTKRGIQSGTSRNDKYHGSGKLVPHLHKLEKCVTQYINVFVFILLAC